MRASVLAFMAVCTVGQADFGEHAEAQVPPACCDTFGTSWCAGCVSINNCGDCFGGCNAFSAQICATYQICTNTDQTGFYTVDYKVNCFYKLLCVTPVGCPPGDCILGGTPFGYSSTTGDAQDPGATCP